MSQVAALLVVSHELADGAVTKAAASYYLGMRDAFEAVFRACHKVADEQDTMAVALHVLDAMDRAEREALMDNCYITIKDRRTETVAETLSAV
jgi:hypothetical protein